MAPLSPSRLLFKLERDGPDVSIVIGSSSSHSGSSWARWPKVRSGAANPLPSASTGAAEIRASAYGVGGRWIMCRLRKSDLGRYPPWNPLLLAQPPERVPSGRKIPLGASGQN